MIKATDFDIEKDISSSQHKVRASLVADNKEEVISNGTSGLAVFGLMDDDIMTLGSTCLCATGDFGILDSEGNWHF